MTASRVVIWRHGQTAYNLEGRVQGATDIPLDDVGSRQAIAAAHHLAALAPTALWSSDLMRAQATAGALAELTGLTVVADERLRERQFGSWEGLAVTEIARRWPHWYDRWQHGEDIPEIGMETRSAAAERVAECVREAAASVADGGTLVVSTHGGAAVCGITALLELDPVVWLGLRGLGNAHWAVLDHGKRRSPAWRLLGYDLAADGSALPSRH
jgi:probable phosphoglycerate mutase